MAVTIVATPSATNANSYVTLTEFDTFLDELYPAPALAVAALNDEKNRALVTACAQMTLFLYRSPRAMDGQSLPAPFLAMPNPDSTTVNESGSIYYAATVVPDRMKRAQMLTAVALLEETYTPNAAEIEGNLTAWSHDGVSLSYAASKSVSGARTKGELPQEARSLIAPFLRGMRIVKA